MSDNLDRKYIKTLLSTGTGVALGLALSDPILIVAGTALGTTAGLIVSNRIESSPTIVKLIHQKKVKELLVDKFESDLRSRIYRESDYSQKTEEIISNLSQLKIYNGVGSDR